MVFVFITFIITRAFFFKVVLYCALNNTFCEFLQIKTLPPFKKFILISLCFQYNVTPKFINL